MPKNTETKNEVTEIEVIKPGTVIKGKPELIPAELLNKSRTSYDWNSFEVGDHAEFPNEEASKVRSSVIAFAKGTKNRAPRTFSTRTVTKKEGDKEMRVLEIWRLPDPEPISTTPSPTVSQNRSTQH